MFCLLFLSCFQLAQKIYIDETENDYVEENYYDLYEDLRALKENSISIYNKSQQNEEKTLLEEAIDLDKEYQSSKSTTLLKRVMDLKNSISMKEVISFSSSVRDFNYLDLFLDRLSSGDLYLDQLETTDKKTEILSSILVNENRDIKEQTDKAIAEASISEKKRSAFSGFNSNVRGFRKLLEDSFVSLSSRADKENREPFLTLANNNRVDTLRRSLEVNPEIATISDDNLDTVLHILIKQGPSEKLIEFIRDVIRLNPRALTVQNLQGYDPSMLAASLSYNRIWTHLVANRRQIPSISSLVDSRRVLRDISHVIASISSDSNATLMAQTFWGRHRDVKFRIGNNESNNSIGDLYIFNWQTQTFNSKDSALHIAIRNLHSELVKFICSTLSDSRTYIFELKNSIGRTPILELLNIPFDINVVSSRASILESLIAHRDFAKSLAIKAPNGSSVASLIVDNNLNYAMAIILTNLFARDYFINDFNQEKLLVKALTGELTIHRLDFIETLASAIEHDVFTANEFANAISHRFDLNIRDNQGNMFLQNFMLFISKANNLSDKELDILYKSFGHLMKAVASENVNINRNRLFNRTNRAGDSAMSILVSKVEEKIAINLIKEIMSSGLISFVNFNRNYSRKHNGRNLFEIAQNKSKNDLTAIISVLANSNN